MAFHTKLVQFYMFLWTMYTYIQYPSKKECKKKAKSYSELCHITGSLLLNTNSYHCEDERLMKIPLIFRGCIQSWLKEWHNESPRINRIYERASNATSHSFRVNECSFANTDSPLMLPTIWEIFGFFIPKTCIIVDPTGIILYFICLNLHAK